MLPKERHCPECAGNMEYQLISISYQEKDIDVAIKITGVPALVCSKCNFQLISIRLAKEIDVLVDAIFASLRKQKSPLKMFHSVDVNLAFNQNALANI
jgi:hypothetical protein